MTRTNEEFLSHGQLDDPNAILSPARLKRWMNQSGRQFVLLSASDLVDALNQAHGWPDGAQYFQRVVYAYRAFRMGKMPIELPDGSMHTRTDVLELNELVAARDWLDTLIVEKEAEQDRLHTLK